MIKIRSQKEREKSGKAHDQDPYKIRGPCFMINKRFQRPIKVKGIDSAN